MRAKTESIDMETKERENNNTMLIWENEVKYVERLEIKFVGKKYDTQFTSTGKKKNILCMVCTK